MEKKKITKTELVRDLKNFTMLIELEGLVKKMEISHSHEPSDDDIGKLKERIRGLEAVMWSICQALVSEKTIVIINPLNKGEPDAK